MNFELLKNNILGVISNYPVSKAAIFGSFARGDSTDHSDVDLLIETNKPVTLFQILQLEIEISEITRRKTDIVEYAAIKDSIRERVLSEAIQIL